MPRLSVLIPARCELFLPQTVANVLANVRGDTDVVVVLDGAWPDEPLPEDRRLTVVHHAAAVGQRAATNEAARISGAEYVMKLDAHCTVDEGFDVKLLAGAAPELTVVPRMFNLHAFDWRCAHCGHRTYQGPVPSDCAHCQAATAEFERVVVFEPRLNRRSDFFRFDRDLHFQYWGSLGLRPESQGDVADNMCLLGACWMVHRDRFLSLGGLDEAHGSWGQMGVEVACQAWLSGGRLVVDKRTWFSHMFRTQDGFKFPYPLSGDAVERARAHSRHLWKGDNWPHAVRPFLWLLERFAPVPSWHDATATQAGQEGAPPPEAGEPAQAPSLPRQQPRHGVRPGSPRRGCVYYSDGLPAPALLAACRRTIEAAGLPIVAATLAPVSWPAARNVVVDGERGPETMFRQILSGLEALEADVAFLTEHDVLYHPSHFGLELPDMDRYHYNQNTWKVDVATGRAVFYYANQTSGLCASRDLLVEHYRRRLALVSAVGFSRRMGFEPGTHSRPERVDDVGHATWMSDGPNLDLRHGQNLTESRWSPDEFRSRRSCRGWTESPFVPGWGAAAGIVAMLDQEGQSR